MNIVLTGMMATGKSAVGKKLASILDMGYIDTDKMIENDTGKTITDIFKKHGEKVFRDFENKAVKCVAVLDNHVISTGGGVVKDSKNMEELEKNAIVVCLTADPEEIYRRVSKNSHRPLLEVSDTLAEIKRIMKERKEYYDRCDLKIDTTGKKPQHPVRKIIDFIEKHREKETVT